MFLRFFLLVLLAFPAYIPAYHGGFIWDDEGYLIETSPLLGSIEGLEPIWLMPGVTPQYYPMVFTTFWVEYHLWGLNPFGYHLVNIFLHGVNSGLMWLVLRRLNVPGAWLAAAIFALHPVHVESVAWISERKNVLSGMFYLSSFLAFLRFSPYEKTAAILERGWGWYALALVLFVAALLSKTVTCSLPAVLLLIYWWKRGWPTRRELLAVAPMFLVGFVLAMETARLEKEVVGAQGEDWAFTPVERCLIAGRALCFYPTKLLWPHPLIFTYPRWHIDAYQHWQYLYPAAVVLLTLLLATPLLPSSWPLARLRQALGRGPLTAWLIFAGTLVPALGFVDLYPMRFYFVADHFQYLASIAMIALVVASLHTLIRPWLTARSYDLAVLNGIVGVCVLPILAWLTWNQSRVYESEIILWTDARTKNPDSFLAQYNLGTRLMQQGNPENIDLAIDCFMNAARVHRPFADLYLQLGVGLAMKGQYNVAHEFFLKALKYDQTKPAIYCNLGLTHTHLKQYEEALPYFSKTLELDPDHWEGNYRLGLVLLELGRPQEAIAPLTKAQALKPGEPRPGQLLQKALQATGDDGS